MYFISLENMRTFKQPSAGTVEVKRNETQLRPKESQTISDFWTAAAGWAGREKMVLYLGLGKVLV